MRRFDYINVIPFIDIMLVLLAIVLTTATFITQGKLEVELPEAENTTPVSKKATIRISIDSHGDYFLNEEGVNHGDLEKKVSQLDRDTKIALHVDKGADFGKFVAVIDLLRANRLDNLSIMTRNP